MSKTILALAIAILCGCGNGNSLSRSEASKQLESTDEISKPKIEELKIKEGRFVSLDAIAIKTYDVLKMHDMIDISIAHDARFEDSHYPNYAVYIKPKLTTFITNSTGMTEKIGLYPKGESTWSGFPFQYTEHTARIPIWQARVKEITGIRDTHQDSMSGCDAVADYIIERVFTEWTKGMPPDWLPPATETKQACFKKYDNGWRLAK